MYYYGNETIMSLEQVLRLKPSEVRILEWVRTYEYLENAYGGDDPVNLFLEIKCEPDGVRIRKNRITSFPEYVCEQDLLFPDAELALPVLVRMAEETLATIENSTE